jgi:hypothetical protein
VNKFYLRLWKECPRHNSRYYPRICLKRFCKSIVCILYRIQAIASLHSCSYRWGKTIGHRRAYCSSLRWYMSMESHDRLRQANTNELGDTPVPVPLWPPQIPHKATRARTGASAVRGRRITAWAKTRPSRALVCWEFISQNCNQNLQNASQEHNHGATCHSTLLCR